MFTGSLQPWRTVTGNLFTSTHSHSDVYDAKLSMCTQQTHSEGRLTCMHKQRCPGALLRSTGAHVRTDHTNNHRGALTHTHTHTHTHTAPSPASNILYYSWGRKYSNNYELLLLCQTLSVVHTPTLERERGREREREETLNTNTLHPPRAFTWVWLEKISLKCNEMTTKTTYVEERS